MKERAEQESDNPQKSDPRAKMNTNTLATTYGLTPALEETAQDLLDEYADRIGAPRDARIAYRTAGQQITQAIAEARTILFKRLDPLMRQYTLPTATPAQRQYQATYTAPPNHRGPQRHPQEKEASRRWNERGRDLKNTHKQMFKNPLSQHANSHYDVNVNRFLRHAHPLPHQNRNRRIPTKTRSSQRSYQPKNSSANRPPDY